MPYNVPVLDLDITGVNPNNRIVDEPHTLSDKKVRSIAPNYGPFYAESLIVKEGANILTRGVDYQIVELHQEATLKYGKEISSVILIINPNIGSEVTITYQALGGHYTYSDYAIANLYQSVINDNRPVAWDNIINKPLEFPPTVHRHLLEDVYGFESIVDYLERIKRAITLGQAGVVLEIVNNLLTSIKCNDLRKAKPLDAYIRYDHLLWFLTKRKLLSAISLDPLTHKWTKGRSYTILIDTKDYPINKTLYWEFFNPYTNYVDLFTVSRGSFVTNGDIVELSVYVPTEVGVNPEPLYFCVKENENSDEYMAVSCRITLNEAVTTSSYFAFALESIEQYKFEYYFLPDIDTNDEKRLFYMLKNY